MLVVANMSGMTVVASNLIKWSELHFFFFVGEGTKQQEKSSWFVLADIGIRSHKGGCDENNPFAFKIENCKPWL